ncbi:MAG TPA: ABC transporter ATP-binding protein [Thermoanaerobaculia bacterium]|nr:ABC transporter ATP-binding protein [Thermoanaerobaculia bacterium]
MLSPPAPILIAENLTKQIKGRTIVDSVSFRLQPGEVFGFLGPNGAGKTTTIRMLVGLIRPTAGRVQICGHDIERELESALRCVGCIVETPDLYRFMTGRENLEHFARMLGGIDPDEIDRVGSLVALSHRLHDRVRTYSLGMRQRLGIAQALLGRPRVLILDEPANGLDPAGIREMRELLRTLAHDEQIAVFVSSHLLAEVEMMCDRVAIIHRGAILTTGTIAGLVIASHETELVVDRIDLAVSIVTAIGVEHRTDHDRLFLRISEADIPPIIDRLVTAGVRIFRVAPRAKSLEELFLELTGVESSIE